MNCPSCNAECNPGVKFCSECGASFVLHCPSCNADCKAGSKFCNECGAGISGSKSSISQKAASVSAVETPASSPGERRQLTVMFCDVVNSTALSETLDPEDLRDYMRLYQETCAKVIHRFDGYIAKYLGDGLLVHFGYPNAHEDDAQRAVRAGLGMLEALKFYDYKTGSGQAIPIELRIGIHTGLVVIDEIGAESERKLDIVGETPNVAARLQGLAEPNTLIVSASTYHLVAGFFEEEYLGPQTIAGLSTTIDVYRIVHESAARTRLQVRSAVSGLTPMVGRDTEIGRLKDLWTNVVEGEGQTVLLSGEAGIGKSRITEALKLYVAKEQDSWLTETECSPYNQNTAFYPISLLFVRTILQFAPMDDAETRYTKLEGFLAQYGYAVQESVPLLAPMLSLPPNPKYQPLDPLALATRQKTMELLLHLLMRRASIQPVLFIVEDLHWADPSTLELLGMIVSQTPGTKLLTYFTFRPEFKPPWAGQSNVQLITLNRLAQGQSREMVAHLVANKKIPESIAIQILKKTDGVPIFIEELVKAVLETGQLVDHGDYYAFEGKSEEIAIPSTLKDSLMARLDRLSTSKLVAQMAATIGREFSYPLLHAVGNLDDRVLQHELSQLVSSGLVFQHGLPPNSTYSFKHALIQEAAYESLLKSRRQEIHRQIAFIIKRDFPELDKNQPETLAIHYTEAGMTGEAVAEWLRAGQQATARFASQESIGDYKKALALLATLPADSPARAYELPLQLMLGIALLLSRGYSDPEVGPPLSRARELCAAVPNAPELPIILWSLWAYYVVRAEHDQSFPIAEELWKIAEERNDEGVIIEASFPLGFEYFLMYGDFNRCVKEMKRIEDLYIVERHSVFISGYVQDVLATSLCWSGWSEFFLGHPGAASRILDKNVAHHRSLGHPYSSAYAGACTGALAVIMEDVPAAEEYGNEGAKISTERGYPFFLSTSLYVLGWVKGRQGNFEESMKLFDQAIGIWNAMGSNLWRTLPYSWKIEIHILHGDYAGARQVLDDCYAEVERTKEPFMLSVLKRFEADITLCTSDTVQNPTNIASGISRQAHAEELYREAIKIAQNQSARSFELEALLRLHELLKGSPRDAATIEEIRVVYDAYTDGFALPLLQRAKAVLDSMEVSKTGQKLEKQSA